MPSSTKTPSASPTYKAEQAKDGTWTIYDVPVFGAHVDNRGSEPLVFSRSWLMKALKAAQTRHQEGYYPPLHIRHHVEEGVEAAGRVRLTRVADHPHGGSPIPTIFADLVGVKQEVYDRIRGGELPYRSVEILDTSRAEIDSLALLDDEVPFFRFPLLRVGKETPLKKTQTPVLAYQASHGRAAVLFNFGASMIDQGTTSVEKAEDAPPAWAQQLLSSMEAIAKALGANKQDEEEEEEESEEKAEDEEKEREEKSPPMSKQEPLEVGKSLAASAAGEAKLMALQATLGKMQGELEAMKQTKRLDERASSLRSRGFSEDYLNKFYAVAKSKGEVAAGVFADTLEQLSPVEPDPRFRGELRAPGGSSGIDPKEVSKYATGGPEVLELARSLHRSYKATKPEMDLGEYLEINMDAEGYFAATRAAAGRTN